MALPDAADAERRDGQAALAQFLRYLRLAPGRLLDGDLDDGFLDLGVDPVLQDRLSAADFLEGEFASGLVDILEAVEAVA